jgi:hypothetical protein
VTRDDDVVLSAHQDLLVPVDPRELARHGQEYVDLSRMGRVRLVAASALATRRILEQPDMLRLDDDQVIPDLEDKIDRASSLLEKIDPCRTRIFAIAGAGIVGPVRDAETVGVRRPQDGLVRPDLPNEMNVPVTCLVLDGQARTGARHKTRSSPRGCHDLAKHHRDRNQRKG